jgi:hypothetical protein
VENKLNSQDIYVVVVEVPELWDRARLEIIAAEPSSLARRKGKPHQLTIS